MAKQTGIAWTTFSVDSSDGTARDIRGDTTQVDWSTTRAQIDSTGLDKSAMERLLGLADHSVSAQGVPNFGAVPSATSHGVLATIPSTTVVRTVAIGIGGVSLSAEMYGTNYDISRDQSGSMTWKAQFMLADGTVPTWA
jgi:hypothetical protein